MCDIFILEIGGMLKFISDCYKNKKKCDKSADNYAHALEFVSDYYKSQKMYNKAVDTYLSAMQFIPD